MSIYIHIPFCKKACHYCNFHFSTTRHQTDEMVNAICREIVLQEDYLKKPLETIYFGGGTPSILTAEHIKKIMATIKDHYTIIACPEITIEANPDDISKEKLESWKHTGINRLSIGTQSFFDDDLQWMNRAHNSADAINSIQMAQDAGFNNITIDLIYGTPTLTDEQWMKNLDTALSLHIPHLSCYALTVEHRTALYKFIEKGKIKNIDNEQQARQFEILMKLADGAGYEQYEISNFAKPGFESKHNSNYWSGKPYLGIGPSAHSFNTHSRQWNISNNALYIQSMSKDEIPFEIETLSDVNKIDEYIMTSLRTNIGLDLHHPLLQNEKIQQYLLTKASKWISSEHLIKLNHQLTLTNKGKLMADGIAADLFV